jgi:hypothetical protein
MVLLITVRLSNSIIRNNLPCNSLPSLLLCQRKTITLITLHKHTSRRNHSMVLSNLLSNFKLRNHLRMVTVCHLINHLMADLHNSGKVLLNMVVHLSITIVVAVALVMAVAVMKLLP